MHDQFGHNKDQRGVQGLQVSMDWTREAINELYNIKTWRLFFLTFKGILSQ